MSPFYLTDTGPNVIQPDEVRIFDARNPAIKPFIDKHPPTLRLIPHPLFESLCYWIISQQIGGRVADKMIERFKQACPTTEPEAILDCSSSVWGVGLSRAKVQTIQNLALFTLQHRSTIQKKTPVCSPPSLTLPHKGGGDKKVSLSPCGGGDKKVSLSPCGGGDKKVPLSSCGGGDKKVPASPCERFTSQEALSFFTQVKGIGEWTMQMHLIFGWGHKDILAAKDLAVRRGVQLLYGLDHVPAEKEVRHVCKAWGELATIGTLLAWAVREPEVAFYS